jgi:phosphoenolpyruvate carboxykinase (GTP)
MPWVMATSSPASTPSGAAGARAEDVAWPCNQEHKYIVHFPEERSHLELWLRLRRQRPARQKMLRLRIASVMARDEGWLAEHMLIVGVEDA